MENFKQFVDRLVSNYKNMSWYNTECIKECVLESKHNYFDCAEYLADKYGITI